MEIPSSQYYPVIYFPAWYLMLSKPTPDSPPEHEKKTPRPPPSEKDHPPRKAPPGSKDPGRDRPPAPERTPEPGTPPQRRDPPKSPPPEKRLSRGPMFAKFFANLGDHYARRAIHQWHF